MLWNIPDTRRIQQILTTTKWECFKGGGVFSLELDSLEYFFLFTSFKKLSVLDRYQCDTHIKLELCGTAAAPSLNAY